MVAIKEPTCKLDKPIMECPEVHPPAYRVPKPTKNPPSTINTDPLKVNNDFQEKSSLGKM
jgi:hypothetical protein